MLNQIDIYSNYEYIMSKNTPKIVLILIFITFLFFIGIIYFLFFYRYNEEEIYTGYVQKYQDNYVLVFYAKDDFISKIESKMLFIEDKKLEFKLLEISEDYYLIEGNNYYQVILKTDISEKDKILNNILMLHFQGEKTTWWQKKGWFS